VALCRLLLQAPDILLLDEPTNHLDAESVAWLERHLQEYPGTVIAVTHDRYFLDNVAGWILELDRGHGIPWRGNYSSWLEQKQDRLAQEDRKESARVRTLQRELDWIRMTPKGKRTKSQARINRYVEDRTRILSAVSHDLKTPITRLRLRAELLDDTEQRESFIRDLAELESMTAATLDFLRGMQADEPLRPVDLRALIESLAEDAAELGHEVTVDGDEPEPVAARPLALKRCLANLIDNAVKYGDRARVSLQERVGDTVVRVVDEGPGIPEAERERVFEPFYRLESSRSRETGGAGLGLTIARSIARGHGGDLSLNDGKDGGLEAVLTLPR